MGCATLKRAHSCESQNQRQIKRRRCNPFEQSSVPSTSNAQPQIIPKKVYEKLEADITEAHLKSTSNTGQAPKTSHIFSFSGISKLSTDKVSQNIRNEIKRLYKRKQLFNSSPTQEIMQESEFSGSEMGTDNAPSQRKVLFTFKQLQLNCERILKEREEEIRLKYNAVLNARLAEQYDAFVKFTHDQIQRRTEAAPSYLS